MPHVGRPANDQGPQVDHAQGDRVPELPPGKQQSQVLKQGEGGGDGEAGKVEGHRDGGGTPEPVKPSSRDDERCVWQ